MKQQFVSEHMDDSMSDCQFDLFSFPVDGGNAINKILFLKTRAMKKDSATLLSSGPLGNLFLVQVSFLFLFNCAFKHGSDFRIPCHFLHIVFYSFRMRRSK